MKRNYQELKVKEAWFILTDLGWLPVVIATYKQRMEIEEMFRGCKIGGYSLEGSCLRRERLIKMILLMAIAFTLGPYFKELKFRKNRCKNIYLAI